MTALVAQPVGAVHAQSGAQPGTVPNGAQQVMDAEPYTAARWLYNVVDADTGEVLMSNRPDEMVFTGSTAKNFTLAAAYATLGPDYRVTTPVYATAPPRGGTVDGNLVLVAQGDLPLGGRGALQGVVNQSFSATTVDHVYGDVAPNAVKNADDPLAGLNSLAAQIAARGISHVKGDVIIDDRLWTTFPGREAPVPPIFVNDNLLDITVTPSAVGSPASVDASPVTSAFDVVSMVTTDSSSDATLSASADPNDAHRVIVTGSIGTGAGPRLTVYRIPDAASWARTLFIEALVRAGVRVDAKPTGLNQESALPDADSYSPDLQVASLDSPPLSAIGKMILETSYNTGGNAVMCMLAVHAGSTNCLDGLKTIRALIGEAGLDSNAVVLTNGDGADPASVTPEQMTRWLAWTQTQAWGPTFKAGLPVLGESGTLAAAGLDSVARGMIAAKTGTSAAVDPATGRILFNVQSMAGFMQTDDGRTLAFDLSMSGATYDDPLTGLVQSTEDVGEVAAQFQHALSHT